MNVSVLGWKELIENVGIPEVNNELDERMQMIYIELLDLSSVCNREQPLKTRLKEMRSSWLPPRDQYSRNVVHLAAFKGNSKLLRCLVHSGGPINECDGIGQTPLTLAMHAGHIEIAGWLIENGSNVEEEDFIQTISPLEIATVKEQECLKLRIQDKIDKIKLAKDHVSKFYSRVSGECESASNESMQVDDTGNNYSRCININVGDQKNTVNIQGCVNRCPDIYACHTPGGGDFHNRGYVNESIARIAGHGGFWHVVEHVMKRPTINQSSFKNKFKENNYNNNEEALRDYDDGLSISMVKEFQASQYFPSKTQLDECLEMNDNHNQIILDSFKTWSAHSKSLDEQFAYQYDIVSNLIPITRWYKEAIRNGNGISVEGVWMLCPQLFSQVGKVNYRDESFTQLVNALGKWPIAYRKMYQQNRTVNLEGKEGHQLAGDEWVEGYLVRPVKQYAAAQSSFSMLEMMSCNVNVLEMNRKMYKSREAFDIHRTSKHKTPSSFYDQLRIAQFALKEKWFQNLGRKNVKSYPWAKHKCKENESVPKKYLKALEKGNVKAELEFTSFMHRKYPCEMT